MQEFKNFKLIKVTGTDTFNWFFTGTVEVTTTTGMLWFKKTHTEIKEVGRKYAGYWCYSDTGKYTPSYEVETLVRAYEIKHGKDLEYIEVDNETIS